MSRACQECQAINAESARFCAHCGAPLTGADTSIQCPACGAKPSPGAKFCDACGAALPAGSTLKSLTSTPVDIGGRPWIGSSDEPKGSPRDPSPAKPEPAKKSDEPSRVLRRSAWRTLFALLLTFTFFALVALLVFEHLGSPEIFIVLILGVAVFFAMRWAWKPGIVASGGTEHESIRGRLVGEARNVTVRQEFQAHSLEEYTIWSFRLDRYDAAGNRLDPIAIELRGLGVTGTIAEGDRVAVTGKPRRDKPLRVKMVYNLTTHSRVSARIPIGYRISKAIGFLLGLIVLTLIVFFVFALIMMEGP